MLQTQRSFWFIIVPSFLKTIILFQQSLWPFEAKYPIFKHWKTADRNVPPIVNCYIWLAKNSILPTEMSTFTMYLLCVSDKIRMIRVNISKFHVNKPFNLRREEWKTSCESIKKIKIIPGALLKIDSKAKKAILFFFMVGWDRKRFSPRTA